MFQYPKQKIDIKLTCIWEFKGLFQETVGVINYTHLSYPHPQKMLAFGVWFTNVPLLS